MNIVVLKFGGTSVADNEKLNIVADKICTLYDEGYSIITVVSAQGKRTDELINNAYELTNNPNPRELDVLLSTGEQETISKLGIVISSRGYKSVSLTGWQAGIHTSKNNQNSIIERVDNTRITKELKNGKIVIVAGYQGINDNEDITTLGRGGSDTTALALAATFKCKCYIYSDVDGIFTTDPRKTTLAQKISNISYNEMFEMSNEGAKVLHDRCIEIAKKFNIPIIAKSTFEESIGTIIDNRIESTEVRSLVKNDELIKISIEDEFTDYFEIYKLLLINNIFPIEYELLNNKITFTIKACDYLETTSVIKEKTKHQSITANKYSRISIVGYSIVNNSDLQNKILESINDCKDKIDKIEVNNGKIRIVFKEIVSNDILERLHVKLIK